MVNYGQVRFGLVWWGKDKTIETSLDIMDCSSCRLKWDSGCPYNIEEGLVPENCEYFEILWSNSMNIPILMWNFPSRKNLNFNIEIRLYGKLRWDRMRFCKIWWGEARIIIKSFCLILIKMTYLLSFFYLYKKLRVIQKRKIKLTTLKYKNPN